MSRTACGARAALVFGAGLALCATTGCATTQSRSVWIGHVGYKDLPRASERDVAVYLSDALLDFEPTVEEGVRDWRFPDLGRSVARWFVADLRERFANVGRIDFLPSEASERDDFPLVVDLRVEDVEWSLGGVLEASDLATVRLSLTVYDSRGAEVFSRDVEGSATVAPVISRNQAENVARLVSSAASNATRNAATIVEALRVDGALLPRDLPINDWDDLRSTAPPRAEALVADSPVSDGSIDLGWAMVNQSGFRPSHSGYFEFGLRAVQRSRSGPFGGVLLTLGIPEYDDLRPYEPPSLGFGLAMIGGLKPDWDYIRPFVEGGLGFGALWGDGARAFGPAGRWGVGVDLPYDQWGVNQALGLLASGNAVYDIGLTDGEWVPPSRWLYSFTVGVRFTVTVPMNQVAAPTSCAPICTVYDK